MTPTTCADSGTLRAHLDHPDAELERHLDTCEDCAGLLRAVAADTGTTARALRLLDHVADGEAEDVDVEAALAAAAARRAPAAAAAAVERAWWRRPLTAAAAVLALAVAVVVTPAGQGAVAQLLDAFRAERLTVVELDPRAVATGLEELAVLGSVDLDGIPELTTVPDLAAGEAVAGITGPALPAPPDEVIASPPGVVTITLAATGDNDVPADLDGASLVVAIPGAVAGVYGDPDSGTGYAIGRTGTLEITADGAPLADVRAFLLSRDELPESLRQQLEAVDDWRHTLPIPVPDDGPAWREVTVGGRDGVAFGDDTGLGAAVLWQDRDGGLSGIGGFLPVSEALALAEGV